MVRKSNNAFGQNPVASNGYTALAADQALPAGRLDVNNHDSMASDIGQGSAQDALARVVLFGSAHSISLALVGANVNSNLAVRRFIVVGDRPVSMPV